MFRKTFLSAAGAAFLGFANMTSANALYMSQEFDRHVTIVNYSDTDITGFYAISSDPADGWQDDILGRTILDTGYQTRIDIDDHSGACSYNFRAVFSDGSELIRRNVNVCAISTYTYR